MVLEEVCNSSVYDTNAFYLLGLTVDVTGRKLRRRQEDFDGIAMMGSKSWEKEFSKYLLGFNLPPKEDETKNLFERLKDPEYLATEMFFWFWPQQDSDASAIELISRGERDKAIEQWRLDMNKGGARGIIARHNLAIILHFYAIEGEKRLRKSTTAGGQSDFARSVDSFWKSAFRLWEDLSDDDAFWDMFAERVKRLDDPRLDKAFLCDFRERFPVCFDNINADFMVDYAQSGNLVSAKRHFNYMVMTMDGVDDVEETMERAFKPMADKVRVLIKQCEKINKPQEVLKACRELIAGSKQLVKIFKELVPHGNTFTKNLQNDIVSSVADKLPLYSRETGDYETCLGIAKDIFLLAATPMMKERVLNAINELEDLVKQKIEDSTCVVCGSQINIQMKDVALHSAPRPDPIVIGRYGWQSRTISVPVCTICASRFKPSDAKGYSRVKRAMSEGFKLGEKPSQDEVDLMRLF